MKSYNLLPQNEATSVGLLQNGIGQSQGGQVRQELLITMALHYLQIQLQSGSEYPLLGSNDRRDVLYAFSSCLWSCQRQLVGHFGEPDELLAWSCRTFLKFFTIYIPLDQEGNFSASFFLFCFACLPLVISMCFFKHKWDPEPIRQTMHIKCS